MKKQISQTEFIEIYFDDEKSLLYAKWLPETKNMDDEATLENMKLFVKALKEYKPAYVITDDREKNNPFSVEVQEEGAKLVTQALIESKVKKQAIIQPQELISKLSTEQIVEEVKRISKGQLKMDFFVDEETAQNWLFS